MTLTRRAFLEASGGGIALLIGFSQLGCSGAGADDDGPGFVPNQWLRIDGRGRVTVTNDKSEMGQGAATAIPVIVADELGVDIADVTVVHAQPGPTFADMGTMGSSSVASRWLPLRTAAAAAREMLIAAAAARLNVPADRCVAEAGVVRQTGSRRRLRYGELVAAAAALPVPSEPTLKPAAELRLIGTRVPRFDAGAVVTGANRYAGDIRLPGMKYAVIARCPVHGGKVARWSADRARRVAGVASVVEVASGIAVVADTSWSAIQGRAALEVDWDEGPNARLDSAALWRRLEGGFASPVIARKEGSYSAASAAAARRLDSEYRYPFQAHAAVEPLTAVARVADGRCEIWAGTQNPNAAQDEVARALGIGIEAVTVRVLPLGGGFGRRIASDYVVEAALVARTMGGVPVQLLWTREDDLQQDMLQSAAIVRMSAALDAGGRIIGWRHRIADFHLSMFGDFDPKTFDPVREGEPWGGIDTPYDFPALEVGMGRMASPVRTGAWRAVFYPSSVAARECFLDEVAVATGRDPLALRLALLAKPRMQARRGGSIDNNARLRAVLELAAERAGWPTPRSEVPAGRRAALGIACNEYHRSTMVATVAEVSVGEGGDVIVHRIVTAMDCGRVVNLSGVEAQIEGGTIWALSTLLGREITFAGGRVEQSNYDTFPVLRMNGVPRIESHLIASELHPSGVGEQPVPAVIPAVLNGIGRAGGKGAVGLTVGRTDRRSDDRTIGRSDDQTIRRSDDRTIRRSDDQTIRRPDDQTIRRSDDETGRRALAFSSLIVRPSDRPSV